MKVLSHLSLKELEELALSFDEPKFRAQQLHTWIWAKSANSLDDMHNLSKSFKEKLSTCAVLTTTQIKKKQISADGTIKYLLEFEDGECVETVLMRFDNRANLTACVSSQVGCPMGCDFCATGKSGFKRNLTPFEITDQILTIQKDTGLKVTNVVFMGQGEPFNNWENVYGAIELINNDLKIGIRRITVSTCGVVPKIYEMCNMPLIPTLAISLHAPNSAIRKGIMPVENKYDMGKLKEALLNYTERTDKRITLEYVLLKGVNDSRENALELCRYIKDIKCNVNLIPYNPIKEGKYQKPDRKDVMKFRYILESSGKKVTVRLERGADIDAACGQLRGKLK